jgi:hypothetical protein
MHAAGEGHGVIGSPEGEHQGVADVLDDLPVVLEGERPDERIDPGHHLDRRLVALGFRELGERLNIDEGDRRDYLTTAKAAVSAS